MTKQQEYAHNLLRTSIFDPIIEDKIKQDIEVADENEIEMIIAYIQDNQQGFEHGKFPNEERFAKEIKDKLIDK